MPSGEFVQIYTHLTSEHITATGTEEALDRKDDDIAKVADKKRERIILQSWL